MKIETEHGRNPPFESIQRDKPELQKHAVTFENTYGVKSTEKPGLKTGKRKLQPKPIANRLKWKKYTVERTNTDNSVALESVELVRSFVRTIGQTNGVIRTAVKGTANGVGRIQTMVKNGVKICPVKSAGRIVSVVGGGVNNVAKDTGRQMLKTKIDKSTITDTGTESIKQGATYLRYVDNARKSIGNTAKASVKAVQNAKKQAARIRKNIKRVRKVVKKTAVVMGKVLTSKIGLIIILAAALILIIALLFNGLITMLISAVSSMFSWMFPDGDASDSIIQNNISTYISQIQSDESAKQTEIDSIINTLSPEYRYDGSQIEGLNQMRNSNLQLFDYNAVLAVLAVQKYQKVLEGGTEDFHFTDEEIQHAMEMFYNFSYHYEYDYCPNWDCSKDEDCLLSLADGSFEITETVFNEENDYYEVTMQGTTYEQASAIYTELEVYMTDSSKITGSGNADVNGGIWTKTYNISTNAYNKIEWEKFYLTIDTVYCNNPNHCYLYGEVVNYTTETVMNLCGFSEDERSIFEMYCAEIQAMGE